ncbi:chlorite dismutase family protein [Tessaracoccus sp. OS52]|uniref:hydrogen peroxide-dependent heme synthase n=1 Tax=Tessaracoccus sp. OS52 TaxID=2886691 RepID=UPI001D103C1A|nr:hydrogen peroxide-dependent heme synthase [Tessaracoccus sp. OS52]MCC2592633.1 chlorite dismutase family protein [Tessaracoccus sp. OS52]
MSHPSRDHRDATDADLEAINSQTLYAMYSVFLTADPLPEGLDFQAVQSGLEAADVEVRGFYDVGGFRADADLLVWTTADSAEKLQAAYHALRASDLGAHLEPVWSVVAVHRPAEFNRSHVPACFAGFAPRPWVCVYPFVRSFEWYSLPEADRSRMLREHGMAGREYPDVIASTLSSFALGDYEWILAFEADELHRLTDVMRHQRSVEARLHVREETPFFTGPRVELAEWAARQPKG